VWRYGAVIAETKTPYVTIVPANEASWEDLQTVFGTRGDRARCQCSRYKMQPWASVGPEELAFRLRSDTDCGHPESDMTSGLVAYLDGEPVGWCAVPERSVRKASLIRHPSDPQTEKRHGTVRGFSVVDPGGNWLRVVEAR